MTRAAPITGISTHGAGRPTVSSWTTNRPAMTRPTPNHDRTVFNGSGIRASTPTAVANSAPTANSHTLAKVLKYAHVGDVAVSRTAHHREAANTALVNPATTHIRVAWVHDLR